MTEHLQECWATYPSDPSAWCICDELRVCEQRVLDAAEQAIRDALSGDGRNLHAELTALAAIHALRKDPNQHEAGFVFVKGYAAALDTAREAVAVIRGKWVFGPRIYKHEALTAIDALKEKS